jgi:galactose mutarotase-like enzyme
MKHTLSNGELSVSIQQTGIELCSVISLITGTEFMWQADPDIWGSHAPVLFPIIGALKNGEYSYKGDIYTLPKHGIVRRSDNVLLSEQTDESLLFTHTWDSDSLKIYPFKFEFQTRYSLSGTTVSVDHTVNNHGAGPMYFSLGGHPAFNCPVHGGEAYSDHYLEFEKKEANYTWLLNSDGLVSNERRPMLDDSKILPLHKHLFDDDALIFKNLRSRKVSLVSEKSGRILTLSYEGFPFLGIWAKPGAPFVCIEPWQGIADADATTQEFTKKEGIIQLGSGEVHRAGYSIAFYP